MDVSEARIVGLLNSICAFKELLNENRRKP
jgi:hypothetical protein